MSDPAILKQLKQRAQTEMSVGNFQAAEILYYDLIEILYRAEPGNELGEAFQALASTLKAQEKEYSPFLVLAEKVLKHSAPIAGSEMKSRCG